MSSAVDVELRLRLRDGATAGVRTAAQAAQQAAAAAASASERAAQRAADAAQRGAARAGAASEGAAQRAADAAQRGAARQRGSYEALSQARETLGVRSEKTIQKEIESTRRAYAKLSAAGFASAQEQERAYAAVQARVTRLTNEMGRLTSAQKKAADEAQRTARQRGSYEAVSQARETLGVRSEKSIQKEIESTRRAYAKLSAAGFASAQEQERAYAAVQARVTRLTNEMGNLTSAQRKAADEARRLARIEADEAARRARAEADVQRGQKVLRYGAAGIVGTAAAAYTLKGPVLDAMSYDERIAHMANTAFSGQRDAAGRKMGAKTLEEAVNKARRAGGGTRDQAAEALDTMIASNAIPVEEAMKILPTVVKQARAAKANPNDIALTAVRAMQTFKISSGDLEAALSGAQVAGQGGSFELKNMAKWLPEQMAMAKQIGLSGKEGLVKLLSWNQASAITSGTPDQAGNNMRDLFNELNTPHFRLFMSEQYLNNGHKIKRGNKEAVTHNLDEVYLDYQSRGIDKVTATTEMMNTIFGRNKKYKELQAQLNGLDAKDPKKDPKRKEIIEAMAAQVQGVTTGKVFHNQQSLMALLGITGNASVVEDVKKAALGQYQVPKDQLESSISHSVIADTPSYQLERAGEEKAAGQKVVLDELTPAIGRAAAAFSDLAAKHPLLVGTTTLATTALAALAGAAGITSVAMGGRIPGVSLPGAGAVLGAAGRFGAVGAAGAVGYGAGTLLYDHALAGNAAGDAIGRVAAKVASFFGSKEAEDALQAEYEAERASANPGKYSAPRKMGERLGSGTALLSPQDFTFITDKLKPVEQKPVDVNFKGQLGLAPGLVLQSQSMQTSGGNVQMNTGNIMTGAPR